MPANKRYAVLDLGSNTFHLLIVEADPNSAHFREIYRERVFVYLGKGGVDHISASAFEEGMATLKRFRQQLEFHAVDAYRCIGTATFRSARNGAEFIGLAKQDFGFDIEVISGHREAELIYKGIVLAGIPADNTLIIDIGGGSVEILLCTAGGLSHYDSKPLGISVLRSSFSRLDPPSKADLAAFIRFVEKEMGDLQEKIRQLSPLYLVGASGPFEIISAMTDFSVIPQGKLVPRAEVERVCESIIACTLDERMALPNMPKNRADLSMESMLFIKYFLQAFKSVTHILISPYALKEGCIAEMVNLD